MTTPRYPGHACMDIREPFLQSLVGPSPTLCRKVNSPDRRCGGLVERTRRISCRLQPNRGADQKLNGSVTRAQRPLFTTARNEEFAPCRMFGPKLTFGPLKMSW
jgi:hypothetical protein